MAPCCLRRATAGGRAWQEPLLQASSAEASHQAGLARLVRSFVSQVQDFWEVTNSETFLESPLSRRGMVGKALAAFYLLLLIGDASTGCALVVYLDALALALVVATWLLVPHKSLLADALYGCVLAAYHMSAIVLAREGHVDEAGIANEEAVRFLLCSQGFYMSLYLLAGVRAPVMLLVSAEFSWLNRHFHVFPPLFVDVFALVVVAASVCVERHLAGVAMIEDAHNRILQHGNLGHCCIDRGSGRITDATAALVEFFGDQLQGKIFADLLDSDADRRSVEGALAEGATGSPFLLTFSLRMRDSEVEVKVIPFAMTSRRLKLCMQPFGERRDAPTDLPAKVTRMKLRSHVARTKSASSESRSSSSSDPDGGAAAAATAAQGAERALAVYKQWSADRQMMDKATCSTKSPIGEVGAKKRREHRKAQVKLAQELPPVLPHLTETPEEIMMQMLGAQIAAVNPRGVGCCSWHIKAWALRDALEVLLACRCKPNYTGNEKWQCRHCHTVHERGDRLPPPAGPRSSSSGDEEAKVVPRPPRPPLQTACPTCKLTKWRVRNPNYQDPEESDPAESDPEESELPGQPEKMSL